MKLNYGDSAAIKVSERIGEPVATLTAMKAIPADRRVDGQIYLCLADGKRYRFSLASALTGDDLLVVAPTAGSGRFLLMPGLHVLEMPIAFGTLDAAILLTMQAGSLMLPVEFFWKVSADFTGGAASTIGLSSSTKSGATTKGDLLGGAAGDVAATLVASAVTPLGTIGTTWATIANRRKLWIPTDTLRFDRITSAFTAGSGFACAVVNLLRNDGA